MDKDLNTLISGIRKSNTPLASAFGLDAPLPYSSVRRKLEIKRRKDIFHKLEVRQKCSAGKKRKQRTRALIKVRVKRWRERGNAFKERVEYYSNLEKSYWYYLKRKYGTKRILTLEEFDTHIAPVYTPGKSRIERIDKSRKDFFLDNIRVVNE